MSIPPSGSKTRVLLCLLLAAAPVWAQKARPVEGMSEQQRADYPKLMRGYVDAFRILGRAKACRLDFDAAPLRREVARRHGEKSEAVAVADLGFAAGAERLPAYPGPGAGAARADAVRRGRLYEGDAPAGAAGVARAALGREPA